MIIFFRCRISTYIFLALQFMTFIAESYVPAKVVKWYPGHYHFKSDSRYDATTADTFLKEVAAVPNFRGFQVTYDWKDLESTQGDYNFLLIEKDIALLKKYGKKLSIMIGFKYQVLPDYIYALSPASVNGVMVPSYFKQISGAYTGHIANFGHPGTFAGFTNLIKKLAEKYDTNLDVSYFQISETSSSIDTSLYPNYVQLEANYLTGIYKMQTLMGASFLHTPIIQSMNSPRNELVSFMNHVTSLNLGFGGPDTFFGAFDTSDDPLTRINSDGSSPGIYNYNVWNEGVLPIGMQVHANNLKYSSLANMRANPPKPHNLSGAVSVDKVYSFAYNKLRSNFLAWQVYNVDIYMAPFKKRLLEGSIPLVTSCPKIYLSCDYDSSSPPPTINKAPIISSPLADLNWTEGVDHTNTIPLNSFTDPDGDVLSYTAQLASGGALPAWITFNASTLTLAGKPPAGAGNLVVRIQAKDSGGLSIYDDFNLVTLTVLNQPPTLVNSLPNKSWDERSYNSYTIPTNTFSDPNGDPLSYTARRADGSALPSWMTFNASTRTLSGKPPRRSGIFTIRIRVKDPEGLTAYDDMTISTP